jgi:hypothetical protein
MSMSKICFCDLDGVVVNKDAFRFAKAEEEKQMCLASGGTEKEADDIYRHFAFLSDLVYRDMPIEGARDALNKIAERYEITFLTSRPEYMRRATQQWLSHHRLMGMALDLVMKPAPFQRVKTVVWKAGIIHTLAFTFGASEILVVDDEQLNLDELLKYDNSASFFLRCYQSLGLVLQDDLPVNNLGQF